MADRLDVGFAGAGRMGVQMMSRLLEIGHDVRFFDPDPTVGGDLGALGGHRVSSAAELGAAAVSVSVVTDGSALRAALLGPSGLARGLTPGHLHVSMSTIGPDVVAEVAAAAPDLALVDAPVSGSVAFARNGELTTMVGAAPEDFRRALPLLRALTRVQFHVGGLGTGSALKLAVNTAVAATTVAVAEAIVLAEAHGIAADAAYDVLLASVISSPFVHYKRMAFLHADTPVEGSVAMLKKDLELALASAAAAGVGLPGASTVRDVLQAAADDGFADADVAAVVRWMRNTVRRVP